jgi:ATP-dependent Clp protease ATP-binding subunit ClpC
MLKLPFRLEIAELTLDSGERLLLPLFFPEISAVGRNVEKLIEEVHRGAAWIVQHEVAGDLHRRRPAATPQVRSTQIELAPPRGNAAWTRPVEMAFPTLVWPHGAAVIAYVPALDIEVVAEDEEQLQKLLPGHIRFALLRTKAAASLRPLVWLQRARQVRVITSPLEIAVRTPRERAAGHEQEQPSTLRDVTSDLTAVARHPAYERDELVTRLAEALTGRRPRSVLLVGASGVGKTAIVAELARRRDAFVLGQKPLRATTGARLVSGMTGYGMWQERCQNLCREAAKHKAIIHFGNLVELMEVGKHEGNQQGVASFLRPYFERGDVLAICECTPEQLAHIERLMPNLLDVFLQIRVEEPTASQNKSILRRYAAARNVALAGETLDAIDRLHHRYATYSASPGRPLRFLHNLLEDAGPPRGRAGSRELSLDAATVTAAFSAETGLPLDLLDESRPLDLRAARRWFGERILGQEHAVDLVIDLLAAVKAGLTRPQRPIASLLFIGPTGVGKTEMAKALAEFLYHDPRRMTRIDMSEYADPLAADRLIGGTYREEGFLTAQVREQPFGVVLLDEFEKAHSRLFDMLLQVLGEGRLTDAAGRLADFSNAVIIMTSNLGAEEHKKASLGFGDGDQPAGRIREHYLRAVRRFLRPELFNRIDRVVPFNPLDGELLRRIARRELDLLERRDGVHYRDLHLELTDQLAARLTEKGYNPRYGARPLKRAMERELLAPLADALNNFAYDAPLAAEIDLAGERLRVKARGRAGEEPGSRHASRAVRSEGEETNREADGARSVPATLNAPRMAAVARQCVELRREAFRIQESHAVLDIDNTVFRLEAIEKRLLKGKAVAPQEQERLRRLAHLRGVRERARRLAEGAAELEEQFLLACYQAGSVDADARQQEADFLAREMSDLVFDLYALNFSDADLLTLVVYGEDPRQRFALARGYFHLAKARGYTVGLYSLRALTEEVYQRLAWDETNPLPPGEFLVGVARDTDRRKLKSSDRTVLRAERIAEAAPFLAEASEGVIGLALRISGPLAFPLLEPEHGLHLFHEHGARAACLVHTAGQDFGPLWEYAPPDRIDRRGAIGKQRLRRQIDWDRGEIDDRLLETNLRLPNSSLGEILAHLAQRRLIAQARKWLGL